MTKDELLQQLTDKAGADGLTKDEIELMKILMADERDTEALEADIDDRKRKRIGDWVRWALGGLGLGAITWATMYYEENSIVSGTRGRVLGKVVDKAINRRKD